jgi:hypothetical protein
VRFISLPNEQKWKIGAEKGTAGLHANRGAIGCAAISDKLVTKGQGNGKKPHRNCGRHTYSWEEDVEGSQDCRYTNQRAWLTPMTLDLRQQY